MLARRAAIVIVLDSVGIGELPDAALYEDQGSNTLGNIAAHVPLQHSRRSRRWACRRLVSLDGIAAGAVADARPTAGMAERSPGKDSVTGHWELMGVVLDRAVPDVPERVSRRT